MSDAETRDTFEAQSARMGVSRVEALRDALSRVTRALEAIQDGDRWVAEQILDDLGHDLWRLIEAAETRR